jgi:hypothetical protein
VEYARGSMRDRPVHGINIRTLNRRVIEFGFVPVNLKIIKYVPSFFHIEFILKLSLKGFRNK